MSLPVYGLLLSLLGGLVLLDKWALGELGISQPIVSCPLFGLVLGDFRAGLFLGVALQLVWIEALPLGSDKPLDYQASGVSAAAGYFLARRTWLMQSPQTWQAGQYQVIFACLLVAALASIAGQYTDHWVKLFNAGLFRSGMRATRHSSLITVHLAGLGSSFLRGSLLTGCFLLLMAVAESSLTRLPRFQPGELLVFPLSIGIAGLIKLFYRRERIPVIAAGAVVSGVIWLLGK